jgi:hypothetical protein
VLGTEGSLSVATFDNKAMVDAMMANEGWLPECGDRDAPDNPPVVRIVEYTTPEGATTWGCVFQGERDQHRYERPTFYVQNPRVIWTKP